MHMPASQHSRYGLRNLLYPGRPCSCSHVATQYSRLRKSAGKQQYSSQEGSALGSSSPTPRDRQLLGRSSTHSQRLR